MRSVEEGICAATSDVRTTGYSIAADAGTFGRGQSLWLWRRKQGTVGGRLRPIVDIHLNKLSVSSALVLGGFTCLPFQVGGQWVWIKRAEEGDEGNAVVDLCVSIGLQKNPADKIWTSSGVEWLRVDGNFGKAMMSSHDAFLWSLVPTR
jgi:hypothetical protein